SQGDQGRLILAALLFLGGALLQQFVAVASTYVGEDVGWTATNHLRADLMDHCLRLDMDFHNERTPGQMIERVDGDVANLAIFFAQFIVRVVASLLLLLGVLVVVLFEDWRISLALAIYTVVALALLVALRRVAVPHWKASREASSELFGFLEEQLAGTEDTRSSGAGSYVLRELFRFNRTRLQKEVKAGTMNILMVMSWFGLFALGQIIAFVAGFLLYRGGTITIGTVFLLIAYTDAIFRPLQELTEQFQHLQRATASIERVEELLRTPRTIRDGDGALPPGALAVAFDRVSFSYDPPATTNGDAPVAAPPVLREVAFALEPRQVLGLLGRTGSGKTTITRLLFRLYDPGDGAIRIGSGDAPADLRTIRLDDLRRHVGIVTQDVQLFRASVRDNLTFFDREHIDDARIVRVLDDLGLGDWYRALPQGLDTELAAGGAGLSAGEAQLLAFTRVFLKDPGLVILDEASSRLDPATEQLIERAVDRLLARRTAIIIAHRLHTVHRADQILILQDGRVDEYGPYAALVNDPGSHFSRLLRTGLEEVLA
ncbi:MAG: ABC transporter ATP-binding protein/permease, partial [Chloroflexota bacterium]|nr:ABC transporter ATP-binding protein/permease [Chloroflexota bacterium]